MCCSSLVHPYLSLISPSSLSLPPSISLSHHPYTTPAPVPSLRGKALFHIITIHRNSWSDCELEGDSPFPEYPVEDLDWWRLHLRRTLPQSQRVAVSYFLEGRLDVCRRRRHGHPALELVVCFLDNKRWRKVNEQTSTIWTCEARTIKIKSHFIRGTCSTHLQHAL